MNIYENSLRMATPYHLDRRSALKEITLGAGAVVLQPFLNALAAESASQAPPPLIVWMSDSAEEHHGQGGQWPMVVVGNLGGRLKIGGRFL
jgi:hypothetical protein